jgi:hypothetical protein
MLPCCAPAADPRAGEAWRATGPPGRADRLLGGAQDGRDVGGGLAALVVTDASELGAGDLKPFVRDLMRQIEHDLATRLECEARLGRLPTIPIPPRSSLSWKRIDQRSARGLGSRSMG